MTWNQLARSLVATGFTAALAITVGCKEDEETPDSGIHPDAVVTHPDARVDSGVHPDAETDSGIHPDAEGTDAEESDAGENPFTPPADHVAISFEIDDSANKTYTQGELRWKGSWNYNATTRVITKDPSWGGPYPTVWDDGPWDAGGHEMAGAVAGDGKWSITVWYPVPQADTQFEYGAENNTGWIWVGANGTFTITAGQTTPFTAQGLVIPAFGTTDMRLKLDMNNLHPDFALSETATVVMVKGPKWGWAEKLMFDDGTKGDETAADRVYTFVLSENLGAHEGLLKSGDEPRFVFTFNGPNGLEYKGTLAPFVSAVPLVDGVTAEYKPMNGTFTSTTVKHDDTNDHNTYITIP
ncbi:MAG: hypothetical protein HY791_16250 [Deltaproteobacteria bacterium]|nr:hypothetical protein [Deltaproteobacteria bacterium]